MARVAIIMADGFEEIEAITLIDVLRRGGIEVTTAGVDGDLPRGAHGISVRTDTLLAQITEAAFDLVVLPGGGPNARTLREHPGVLALLQRQVAAGRPVAAICAAPTALAAAGLLQGKRATCYPGFEGMLTGAVLSQDAVVEDGLVTTSRGPATALAFALHLTEALVGVEVATRVRRDLLVP